MRAPLQSKNDSDAVDTKTAQTAMQEQRFVNNGPAEAQRKLAETMNNSPRVLQQRALNDVIHNSPRMVAQRDEMNSLFGGASRHQEDGAMPDEFPPQREKTPNNTGLPNQLKSGIESLSGISMDHVKVHYNSDKPAQLQAHAYAQGSEIHLGAGQEKHLPHEAWHIVQQAQGRVRPTLQMKTGAVNDDPLLEKEADMMGEKAAQSAEHHDTRTLVEEEGVAGIVSHRIAGFSVMGSSPQSHTSKHPVQRQILITKKGHGDQPRTISGDIDKLVGYTSLVTQAAEQPATKDSLIATEALTVMSEWDNNGTHKFSSPQNLIAQAKAEAQKRIDQDPSKKLALHAAEQQVAMDLAVGFGQGTLHNPSSFLPSTFSRGSGLPQMGEEKGRDDGAFPRTANTLSGARTDTISAPALDLFKQQRALGNYQQVDTEEQLQICPGCSQPQSIYNFEVDHQVAFSSIRDTLIKLAKGMQADPGLLARIRHQLGDGDFERYFAEFLVPGKWQTLYPTTQAVAEYSNDMSNLMGICRTCNGAAGKGAMNFLEWYKQSKLYGQPFLDAHLPHGSAMQVLGRTASGAGWGHAALAWFEEHHWTILKQKLENAKQLGTVQSRVDQQAERRYGSNFATDPQQQADMATEAQHLGGINSVTSGVIKTLVSATAPERVLPMRPGSPALLEHQLATSIARNFDERNRRLENEDVMFDVGRDDAMRGHERVQWTVDAKELIYNRGYDAGLEELSHLYDQGYMDGLSDDDYNAEIFKGAHAYREGYDRGAARRAEVIRAALENPRKPAPISVNEPGAAVLLQLFSEQLQKFFQ